MMGPRVLALGAVGRAPVLAGVAALRDGSPAVLVVRESDSLRTACWPTYVTSDLQLKRQSFESIAAI